MIDSKRDKISHRIKELMKKTTDNGCTEAEALSAAEMVGRLMQEYDLTMTEIEFKNIEFLTHVIETDSRIASPIHNLVMSISKYTNTKSWFSRGLKSIKYSFFGTDQDTKVADYLFHLLSGAIKNETERYKKTNDYKLDKTNGRTKTSSFALGMAIRLAKRLEEMKESNKVDKETGNSLVIIDKMSVVLEKFEDLNVKLRVENRKVNAGSRDSFLAGKSAADKVNISIGLNTSSSSQLKLK